MKFYSVGMPMSDVPMSQVWSEIRDVHRLPFCAVQRLQTVMTSRALCFLLHHSWHKSACGFLRLPRSELRRTSWHIQNRKQKAVGSSVSRSEMWLALCKLHRRRYGWTVHCQPSATAYHWYHSVPWSTKNLCAKNRLSSPETHKDRSVVSQLCINGVALTISKKRLFHY